MWLVEEVKEWEEVEVRESYPSAVGSLLVVILAEESSVEVRFVEWKKTAVGIASSRHCRACRRSRRDSSPWQHLRTGRDCWLDNSNLHTDPKVAFRTSRAVHVEAKPLPLLLRCKAHQELSESDMQRLYPSS